MAFNPFFFLRLAGLLPGLAGLTTTALTAVTLRFGTTAVATRLSVLILRTAGFIQNKSGFLNQPVPSNPATRLLFGTPTFLSPLFGFPGTASFLAGFAFEDKESLVRGWLSFFGELVFNEVPGVEGNAERALKALGKLDFIGFGEAAADAVKEDIGLAGLVGFFNGIAQIERDFQALNLPTINPAPWLFGGIIGTVVWLDQVFTDVGSAVAGFLSSEGRAPDIKRPPGTGPTQPPTSEGRPPDIKRPPPPAADPLPITPPPVPTTEEDVRTVAKAFARFRRQLPDLARIIAILKRERA